LTLKEFIDFVKNRQSEINYNLHFCSVQCFKDFVVDPECLDQYIEDEVYQGRLHRMNPHLKEAGPV
jgi:hypothetical protein